MQGLVKKTGIPIMRKNDHAPSPGLALGHV